MQAGPTVDGRIKLVINDDGDYHLLTELINDASDEGNINDLINLIGQNVEDEDWEEFVKPELYTKFQKDVLSIAEQIFNTQKLETKEIFICNDTKNQWYSTLNQARLHLENQYSLSKIEEIDDLPNLNPELLEPAIKSNFYMQLQSLILEYLDL